MEVCQIQDKNEKSSILDLFKDNNKTESTNSDKEKANVLAVFFTSVFTVEGDREMPDIEKVDVPPLKTMTIIEDKVKKGLDKLNISNSLGPDGIHPRVLKEVSMSLCTPLARIFETSIKTGLLP